MLKRYKDFFEKSEEAFFIIDSDGRFAEVNRKYVEMLGYSREELIGHTARKLVHPDDLEVLKKNFLEIINGKATRFECRVIAKDGRVMYVEIVEWPIFEENRVSGAEGILRDITKEKKQELWLRESGKMFEALAEKSLVGIYLIQDGVFKYVNPKLAELWGYDVDELIGKSPLQFIHPEYRELVDKNLKLRIDGKVKAINYKLQIIRKDGEVRTNEVFGSRVTYGGRPAIIGTLIDITESERYRKKLEEYRRFYENAQDLFFILDNNGRFLDVNPKYAEMLGYSREELIGHTARKLVHPDEVSMVRENFRKVMQGKTVRYEAKAIAKDGREYVMEVILWPVFENGRVVGAEGILRDISEKIAMEKKIRESEEKFRKIFEKSPNLIAIINRDFAFIEANPAMVKNLGTNPIGKRLSEVLPENVANRMMKYIKRMFKRNKPLKFRDESNGRYFINTLVPIDLPDGKYCLVISKDVTDIVSMGLLLKAMNTVNEMIMSGETEQNILRKACEELNSLEGFSATILTIDGKKVSVAYKNEFLKQEWIDEIVGESLRYRRAIRKMFTDHEGKKIKILSFPMIVEREVKGLIVLHTNRYLSRDEFKLINTLASNLASALKATELERLKRKALIQIDRNIEQFAILVDQIRNPLSVIYGLAEMEMDDKLAKIVTEQIDRILKIVEKLDRGWLESEEIRKFLWK
ncbi:PAS domain S-box [Archaeoglobus sulfaticallidus PM70-1]|uniref:histidine kinase n=1 Tax=Archaeoglobus sulfaticallidus PM70-1 TaxID=387631 RepID=N0BMY8_9EURY|nr:PAS domain S-box protein [Archaeoglobus sulfaticallidus]AGK61645.1 PAS domain S-box [Archaeoglobus sulfaticallidus PM70-1]